MGKEKEATQEGADEFRQTLLSLWERHCFKLRCYTFSSREPSENVSNKQLHYSRLHQKAAAQQKKLCCPRQVLSYCHLVVFNKESMGTNYTKPGLVIDNALHLMMCEILGLPAYI